MPKKLIEVLECRCAKCGCVWVSRKPADVVPRMCPRCKSIKWDVEV